MQRVRKVVPKTRKVVLDFGGGTGPYKQHICDPGDAYIVLEVDLSSDAVRRNVRQHQYVIGDGHESLFQQHVFDVICMFEVLEHVHNPFRIVSNCGRWLKPGGILVLSTPQYWHVHGWPNDYFRYTIHGLRELARCAGMDVVDYWPMGGPCVLIWSVIELNFVHVLRFPIVKQLFSYPAMLLACLADRVLFQNNLSRAHPDTRGWMVVVRKPVAPQCTTGEGREAGRMVAAIGS
jgi:SAM-dependent methyltransferase